ncbi:hypothetical protein JCM6882_007304 [Rhodosporidiobolus microsporus]
MLRSKTTLALKSALAHPTRTLPARALVPPSTTTRSLPLLPSRLLSTSSALAYPPRATTNLASSAGSGQGGKKEKDAAKKEKERARSEREKERARKEKEKEKAAKEKEKAAKEKEKAKAQKEKEQAKKQKEKDQREKLRERERKEREKERSKARSTRSKLSPPKAPTNAWGLYFGDFVAERKATLAPGEKLSLTALVKEATPLYQDLSYAEKETLKERVEERKREYPAILEAWKATLTPEMIREENIVRANRKRAGLSRKRPLRLEGEPKRPQTGFLRFSTKIREENDYDVLKGETNVLKQSTLIAHAWRALSEDERKVYNDAYTVDKERYQREKAAFDAEQAKKGDASA